MARPPHAAPQSAVVTFDPKAAYAAIEAAVKEKEDAIVATLAPTIPRERFLSVALQAVTRSPRLLECTPASIVKALRDAAELGLEPSGLMGSAYLVPYRNRNTGRYEAQLIPGYRGLIDLARRSGEVRTIEAHVVREADAFDFAYGTDQFLRHKPWVNLTSERVEVIDPDTNAATGWKVKDAGPYVAVYALARLSSGEVQFDVMSMPEVEAIRRRSKAADDGPWVTDFVEMARKTPTRRLLKYLPLSVTNLTRALELEDAAEGTADQPVKVEAPARARLQAAFLHPSQDAPSDAKDDETHVDTASKEDDGDDAPLTASDETTTTANDAPARTDATVDVKPCGAVSPYGDGEKCVLPTGHKTNHKGESKATW